MALINCPECGQQISDKATVCPGCGIPLERLIKCPDCNAIIPDDTEYCPECGCPLTDLIKCPDCNTMISADVKYCPECGCPINDAAGCLSEEAPNLTNPVEAEPVVVQEYWEPKTYEKSSGISCPRCGSHDLTVASDTSGKGYGAGKGCLGWLLFGPLGLLCGACGSGVSTENYWVCRNCGNKFSMDKGKKGYVGPIIGAIVIIGIIASLFN